MTNCCWLKYIGFPYGIPPGVIPGGIVEAAVPALFVVEGNVDVAGVDESFEPTPELLVAATKPVALPEDGAELYKCCCCIGTLWTGGGGGGPVRPPDPGIPTKACPGILPPTPLP